MRVTLLTSHPLKSLLKLLAPLNMDCGAQGGSVALSNAHTHHVRTQRPLSPPPSAHVCVRM